MNFLQNNFQTLYLGAAAGDIQGRISGALTTVQSILTGIQDRQKAFR